MTRQAQATLSRREREIMDIVYRLGEANVSDVVRLLDGDPGYDSVRITLGILTKKGHLQHRREDRRYIYSPTVSHEKASRSAVLSLLKTFFSGSPKKAILAMLDVSSSRLTQKDVDEITAWLNKEKKS
jgi:predicted transcriptional regulator